MPAHFPKMIDITRVYPALPAWDFSTELSRQFVTKSVLSQMKPGARIAIGVGSRGIANLSQIVSAVIRILKEAGARPFIVPAMGSHGGATSEGQIEVLAKYGVTPESMGIPIQANIETRLIGASGNGVDVFFSEAALSADGIVVINRVKPHTDFSGSIGSGIMKMIAIGLGKQCGAAACHAAASHLGHEAVIRAVSGVALAAAPILCAVAIVEDQNHQTAEVHVVRPESIPQQEEQLFVRASALMPALPFDDIDLLIVDFIGKDISGVGMDSNIIGRSVHGYLSSLHSGPGVTRHVSRVFVRDLTPATNGNAIGIGLADFTTSRVIRQADWHATYINSLTAMTPSTAKIPIYFETDEECISHAIVSLALPPSAKPRVVRILNTLSLTRMQASEAYLAEILDRKDLTSTRAARDMEFDSNRNLLPLELSAAL